ncbi:hypothetical protein TWF281_010375 [Arthrobotrys megalospora]
MKSNTIVPIISIFFAVLKPAVAPDPNLNPALNINNYLQVTASAYCKWIEDNTPTLETIYDELALFQKARQQTCAIRSTPGVDGIDRYNTLEYYITALDHVQNGLEAAIQLAKGEPSPTESAVVTFLRRQFEESGTWEKPQGIANALYNIIRSIQYSLQEFEQISSDVSLFISLPSQEPGTNGSGVSEDTSFPQEKFCETSSPKVDKMARYFANPRWNPYHVPGTVVVVRIDQKDGLVNVLTAIAKDLEIWSGFIKGFNEEAERDGLSDPVYAEILDTPEYNPTYGIVWAKPFTIMDLLDRTRNWYECWGWPVREVGRLSEIITPLPGSPEAEVQQQVTEMGKASGAGAEAA